MKKTIYKIALLAGLVAASSLSAVAKPEGGDKKGPRGGGHGGHDRAAIIEEFDENDDGKLDEGERKKARAAMKAKMEERRAAMIAEHDTDGSGDLNEDERKAMHAAMILKRFDEDNSGDLDTDEQVKADAAMERRKKMHKRRGGKGGKRPEGKRKRPGHKHGDKKDDDAAGGEE